MTPQERSNFVRENLAPALKGRRVLLCISGSIAAYKCCELVRALRECGAEVRVALTESAEKFVTRVTLETLSGQPVYHSLWEGGTGTHHIEAARWAELALVAPATANTIAKLALGLADDLVTTELLAYRGPQLLAPAMNPSMFSHPAVQANLETLRARGWKILGPAAGATACGEEGLGRMLEPEELLMEAARALRAPSSGRRALITLGPTRSSLDPVRYLTNRSSGLMGAALAWAAAERGYDVTAICGPTEAPLPPGIKVMRVSTAAQMASAAQAAFAESSLFISAAAVLDWEVANPSAAKLKKLEGAPAPKLELERSPDVLATLAAKKGSGQFILGFAAETENAVENARGKLSAKNCDAVFANDVSKEGQGFEVSRNAGWWVSPAGVTELKAQPKALLARNILDLIEKTANGYTN
jgi:phosphopantothenoylcysteine decarboxylase/phosphopantothenate--cysteine ligase